MSKTLNTHIVNRIRLFLYNLYSKIHRYKMIKINGMDIGYNVKISRHAIVDRTINPQGIHIGDNTIIAGNAIVLAHDHVRGIRIDTYIGRNCFLGGVVLSCRGSN